MSVGKRFGKIPVTSDQVCPPLVDRNTANTGISRARAPVAAISVSGLVGLTPMHDIFVPLSWAPPFVALQFTALLTVLYSFFAPAYRILGLVGAITKGATKFASLPCPTDNPL